MPPPLPGMPPIPTPLTPAPEPVTYRDFDDVDTARKNIYDGVLKGLSEGYPVENDNYKLEIANARYEGPDHFSLAEQKQAVLKGLTLDRKLKGTWRLTDKKTNQVVSESDKVLGRVPYLTPRQTFIYNGVEWTVASQARLKPGIYARRKDNGELEAHINPAVGTGGAARIHLEPESGVMKLQVGQSHVPLLPVLRALGADLNELNNAWGRDLLARNQAHDDPTALRKVVERLGDAKTREAFDASPDLAVRKVIERIGLDPDVTERTLGKRLANGGKEALLLASQKLLRISRKEAEPDERDSQANMTLMGLEDLFRERVAKDAGKVAKRLLWKTSYQRNLDRMPSSALTGQIQGAILSSGLGMTPTAVNPLEFAIQANRVTRMGMGGISAPDAVPEESHNVSPSQVGYVDVVAGPESGALGLDVRLATGTKKGSDGRLYQTMTNVRTGKPELLSADKAVKHVIAFPGELDDPDARIVTALRDGQVDFVDRKDVDYVIPEPENMYSPGSLLSPGFKGMKGGRLLMAAKVSSQALPLRTPEAPLVRTGAVGGGSYEQQLGAKVGAVFAKEVGKVLEVTPDGITVQYKSGTRTHDLYNSHPTNTKTRIHSTAAVKPGDAVAPGQLLAKSNYTDDKGVMALGTNLRVGYLPWQDGSGTTYEDAFVISQSAASKLTSEHMFQHVYEMGEGKVVDKNKYLSMYPSHFSKQQLETIDPAGHVKPGTVLRKGDPLVLAYAERAPRSGSAIHRSRQSYRDDDAVVWEHDYEGKVVDVSPGKDGVNVTTLGYRPAQTADKLSTRYGGKGVLSKIVPDDQMPRTADGKPLDLLFNPLGVISRVNPVSLVELALGKVARKTGKTYDLRAFPKEHLAKFAMEELKKNGLEDAESVYDPYTGRTLPAVLTGEQFYYRLYHTADTKLSARNTGIYTADGEPAKGPEGQSKRLGLLDLNSLVSHGAVHNIQDMKLVRGQSNPQFWSAFRQGKTLPIPETPLAHKKFLASLQAAGINVKRSDKGLQLLAMTDKDIDKLSHGELENGDAVGLRDGEPVAGGLFDIGRTGGMGGTHWSHLTPVEPLPNPVFEEPIRRVLGLTQDKYEELLSEEGGAGVKKRLAAVDLDKAIALARQDVTSGKRTKRDSALKKLKYLDSAKRLGIGLDELVLSKVPVLPPAYRPVHLVDGMQLTSDANLLYRDLWEANQNLKDAQAAGLDVKDERLSLYKAFKAVSGLGDPVQAETKEKGIAGFLTHIFGKGGPKCYDDDTFLLTRAGWTRFPAYQGGVEVATINPATGAFEWQMPTDVIHEPYVGDMIHTRTRDIDLLVTPNHEHWVSVRGRKGQGKHGPKVFQPYAKASAESLLGKARRVRYKTAADSWVGATPTYSFTSGTPDMGAFSEFAGWWLAEGWCHPDGGIAYVCQNAASYECKRIDYTFMGLGLPYDRRTYRRNNPDGTKQCFVYWSIKDKSLVKWLHTNLGKGARHKRLSAEVLGWDKPLLEGLLVAYLHGDAEAYHRKHAHAADGVTYWRSSVLTRERSRFNTASPQLVDALQELACKVGVRVCLRKIIKSDNPKWADQARSKVLGFGDTTVEGPKQTRRVRYTGGVHCVTVPNGLVVVRRNGMPAVSGNSGMLQRKVFTGTLDIVGRGAVSPNPSLDMDHVGVPEEMAWDLYEPFIMRNLSRRYNAGSEGPNKVPLTEIAKWVKARDPRARDAMLTVMNERPVMMNRAPVWHRYGFMAFKPVLVAGETIQVSPISTAGFGMDFDGDDQINQVFVALDRSMLNTRFSGLRYNEVDMAYLNRTVTGLDSNDALLVLDLSEVPHGPLVGVKDHIEFYEAIPGVRVVALNERTNTLQLAQMSHWSVHKDREVEIVTLTSGKQIITDDDERAVYGVDGDSLAWCRRRPREASRQFVPVVRDATVETPVRTHVPLAGPGGSRLRASMPLDFQSGHWLGMMAGNGWAAFTDDRPVQICLATVVPELQQAAANFMTSIFLEDPAHHLRASAGDAPGKLGNSTGSQTLVYSCAELASLVAAWIGKGAVNKHLPPFCMASPHEFKMGLLAGLWDSDGTVCFSHSKKKAQFLCAYSTSSLRLAQEIQHLLRSVGVVASITATHSSTSYKDAWTVNVSTPDLFELGGFSVLNPDKRKLFDAFLAGEPPVRIGSFGRFRLTPTPAPLARELRKLFKVADDPETYSAMTTAMAKGHISQPAAERTLDLIEARQLKCSHPLFAAWSRLVRSSYHFEQVIDVEYTKKKETGYDLTVPGHETFMSVDGIVLSNTANIQVPATDAAVSEAYEKMLPSKNLLSVADFAPHMLPRQEYLIGLYAATRAADKDKPERTFATAKDALAAYRSGQLTLTTAVRILADQAPRPK